MFFKKNKPSSSQPDEDIFFPSTDPLPYPQGFSNPIAPPERDMERLEAASAPPPLSEAPATPVSHQEPHKTSEDHLEDLWFRMSPPESESESVELKADLDKPEFDFALDIDRAPDIDRAADRLAEATQNIAPMEPIFDAAMPRESASPDWRTERPDSALFPEGSQANSGIAQPNVGPTGYGHLPEVAPWLDPVNRSLYPEGAFGGIENDLEAESRAFEEAARFLFPETVSAPLEWDMPQPGPEPIPMDPATLLGDNWETFSHEARGPVDLGPDFQAGARDLSDLSHQETPGEWSMFMAASSSQETQGTDASHPRPASPLETPLTAGDFAPLSDQPPEAVDLESAWFMESPFPEADVPLSAFASPFTSHEMAPALEDLADQDFYVTEFTFDEEGALIPKTDEAPDFAESALTPLFEPEAAVVWPKTDEAPDFAEPALTPLFEPEATAVWPKTDETPDVFAEPALTPPFEPEARLAQLEPEKDFGPVTEPPEEMAIFSSMEIEEETPDDQQQSQPQTQAETEEPVWNFTETEPEEPSEKSSGAPSFDLPAAALPLEPIPAVIPLIAQAPFSKTAFSQAPGYPPETLLEAPLSEIKPEPPETLPEEHAERPVAPAIRLGNLEVLGICPVRPDCRLLIIHSNGAYALMSQLGREQPQISVLKLFEYNPIAYQSTFVAVENTPHPDRPGRFLVQVGLWRGMVSILKDQVTLYRELG